LARRVGSGAGLFSSVKHFWLEYSFVGILSEEQKPWMYRIWFSFSFSCFLHHHDLRCEQMRISQIEIFAELHSCLLLQLCHDYWGDTQVQTIALYYAIAVL
jgi:hypothetical protein